MISHASTVGRPGTPGRVLARVALALFLAALTPAAAGAAPGHHYAAQFGSPGSTEGSFSSPAGLAVQQSTGDVYVADQSNARVQKFSAGGEFLLAFDGSSTPAASFSAPTGVAVDPTSGDVYVSDQFNNAVDRFSASGAYISQLDATATPVGAFAGPSGVAVDPSDGDVYVANTGAAVVDVFSSSGTYLTQFGSGVLSAPTSVAVDGASNVYVVDAGSATAYKYAALGAGEPSVIDTASAQTVAVDPESSEVYVGENGVSGYQVSEFSAGGGSLVYTFGVGRIGSSSGIAVKASSDLVYVADQANSDVLEFTSFVAPDVTTGGSSEVTGASSTVAGTVNPAGVPTSYHFEYGTEGNYFASSPEVSAGAGGADVSVSAELGELAPNTTYNYRLTASNSSGPNTGDAKTFTTLAVAPIVDGQPPFATAVTATSATLHATINPNNSPATYHFNYGTSTTYGSSAPEPDAQGGVAGEEVVSASIGGLSPSTTYHFQVVADNGTGGSVAGEDETFTTLPPPPAAGTGAATAVTTSAAVLSGAANTHGLSGTYQFLITGTDTPGGGATSRQPLAATSGEVPVSATIAGLSPSMHYSYRLAVTTAGGTVYGAEAPLATAAVPAYEEPGVQGAAGPLSAGLPTPIVELVAFVAPPSLPVAASPKPATHPKSKPKKKKSHKKKKHKPAAKKANTNEKGNR